MSNWSPQGSGNQLQLAKTSFKVTQQTEPIVHMTRSISELRLNQNDFWCRWSPSDSKGCCSPFKGCNSKVLLPLATGLFSEASSLTTGSFKSEGPPPPPSFPSSGGNSHKKGAGRSVARLHSRTKLNRLEKSSLVTPKALVSHAPSAPPTKLPPEG